MPWQNNNDGSDTEAGHSSNQGNSPWGDGGGDGRGRNPWGDGPPKRPQGPRPGGRSDPFDDLLRRGQDQLRRTFGSGGPRGGGSPPAVSSQLITWGLIGVAALWVVMTSFYRVDAQERGVVLRFGRFVEVTDPGLHFKLPWPIDAVTLRKVEQINSVDIGAGGAAENLVLTGDQNIINLAYAVRWKIRNPELYLFELAEPEQTVQEVAESAMRAEIGRASLSDAIGPQRAQIAERVRERMQELLDSYRSGVEVRGVDIKQADPPAAVDAAFKDVSAAQQDAQKYLNESRAYAQQKLAVAQGSAAAFDAVYAQYRLAPEVTRKRMYFETMESVLSKVDKTIVEPGAVQTYLPLPELQRRARAAPAEDAQ
ncbi:peptidase [alpha proteobacterium AAP81b]|nr:peptidase [alpha proteobacterium AAP81b]